MRRRAFITLIGGAAVAWPLAGRAQQTDRVRRVGVLMSTAETDPEETSNVAAFVKGLANLGWVADRNVALIYRWTTADARRIQEYAQELVELAPDVIFVNGACVPAVRQATSTIPIVFVVLSDKNAQVYVASFARPGGNITGFSSDELTLVGKRLELLRDIAPRVTRILYMRGARPETLWGFTRLAEDASSLGIVATDGPADNDADIERTVGSFARKPDGGLQMAFDAFNIVHREKIVQLAAQYHLPAIYPFRFFAKDGGLISYGFDRSDQFRQAASYVDRILKGTPPGDLPVQQPTKFDLVINLKTAKALGFDIPLHLQQAADEVIE